MGRVDADYTVVLPDSYIERNNVKVGYQKIGNAWNIEEGGIAVHLSQRLSVNRIALLPNKTCAPIDSNDTDNTGENAT